MEHRVRAWNGEIMVSPDYVDRQGIAWWKEDSIPRISKDVMFYTGVNDIYGTPIYEGDILRARYKKVGVMIGDDVIEMFGGNHPVLSVKEWDEYIVAAFEKTKTSMTFFIPNRHGGYSNREYKLKWEIVGNTRQNKDIDMSNKNIKIFPLKLNNGAY